MKFAAFVLIASLCWAAVSAGFNNNALKDRIKCTVDEVSKLNDAIKPLPNFSACDGELSKNLAKQREEIIKASSETNDVYETKCKEAKSIGCAIKILRNGAKLALGSSRFVKLLNQINDAPADVKECLKDDIQPYTELFSKAGHKINSC